SPRMMSARTPLRAASSQACSSASYISHVRAFLASGRLNVSVPIESAMSQSTLLDGIVVLDASQVMAGPYCAMLLADMGARVIKVEPPAGDTTRTMAGARSGESAAFNAVNRGKQGIVLDLAEEAGCDVFRRLARSADVLIENYRPGVMRRLGLDYEALALE